MRPRTHAWIAMLAVAAAAAVDPGGARAATACVPLHRLLQLADTRFNRLRGYFDPRLEAWVATYRMPGATLCTIQDTERAAYYTCRWVHDPKAGTAESTYDDLRKQVTTCLDVGASRELETAPDAQVTRFGVAAGRKTVVVGRHLPADGDHVVTLEVLPLALGDLPGE